MWVLHHIKNKDKTVPKREVWADVKHCEMN